ncbi:MAG TPA: alpha-hydroxy acid oxidase [Steroidobacteraceae bacterium]|nr:alpha-hydroxy acid oxidase [Steroidobacteraceae bacterium]
MNHRAAVSRRSLLESLCVWPLLSGLPAFARAAAGASTSPAASPKDVLNVMDFEGLARAALPPAHFGYIATGVDDDRTVAWNHEAFSLLAIRAHRFVDVSRVDTEVQLLGTRWASPVYLSAVASQRAFHPDAESGTARAAASRSALMMLSSASSTALDAVIAARSAPVWYQLYATDDWNVTRAVVDRAQKAGCPAIVFTVDSVGSRNSETLMRAMRVDERQCTQCHINNSHDFVRRSPLYAGLDVSKVKEYSPSAYSWDYLAKLRDLVRVKFLVKGIVTREDAAKCVEHGADGIVVSNHGGRDEETLRSTIESLPEVAAGVRGRVPVLLDGGVRRGTDIFKALALGATAVGVGRPQVWGLAAFGQSGVEAVLDIYNRELRAIMEQAGTPNIAAIQRDRIAVRGSASAFGRE